MSEENNTKFEIREFKGKKAVKKGTDKNGKEWKLFELEFAPTKKKSKYNQKFKAFDSVGAKKGLKLSDMEELELYKIGYNEEPYTHPQHGKLISRTIFWVEKPSDEDLDKFLDGKEEKEEEKEKYVPESDGEVSVPKQSSLTAIKKALDDGEIIETEVVGVTLEDGTKVDMTVKEAIGQIKSKRTFG